MPRRRTPPPRADLSPQNVHHLVGASIADALRVSAELRIEALLDARPWTTSELASHTRTDPHWLESVLRGLANLALIRRVDVEQIGSLWSTNRLADSASVLAAAE
jgi:hypothetical protein